MKINEQITQTIAAVDDAARRFAHDEFNKFQDPSQWSFMSEQIVAKLNERFGDELPFKEQVNELGKAFAKLDDNEKESGMIHLLDEVNVYHMVYLKDLMRQHTAILLKIKTEA